MKSAWQIAVYTIITPVAGALILLLNIAELYCIFKLQKRRHRFGTNSSFLYMSSLCISDIAAGVIMIVLKSMDPFMKTSLKGNVVAKEIYEVLRFVFIRISMFLSILNLLALTADRYFSAKTPIQYRQRRISYHRAVIAGVWVASVLFVVASYCITRWLLDARYHKLLFPISSYPTAVIFIVCYYSIYTVISNRKMIRRHPGRTTDEPVNTDDNRNQQNDNGVILKKIVIRKNKAWKKEMRYLRLAVLNVCLFYICWLPYSTLNVLNSLSQNYRSSTDLHSTLFLLAYCNSLFNPLLYFFHMKDSVSGLLSNRRNTIAHGSSVATALTTTREESCTV